MQLEVKRFYIPGEVIKTVCKHCGDEVVPDLGDDYLSYPKLNTPDVVTLYCSQCDTENEVNIKLTIKLEILK